MKTLISLAASATLAAVGSMAVLVSQSGSDSVSLRARQLHLRSIVVDTHVDTPQRMLFDRTFDIGVRHTDGNFDLPRARDGGLDALFFSIWMPGEVTGEAAVTRALALIDRVNDAVRRHPRDLMLATTAADIRRAAEAHRIAALMGVEGGHIINNDLAVLRQYAALGVRYLTLTHSKNTDWADSSGDTSAHNGLTAFGKDVVRELNRLGVMVDVSHVADKTFYDALEVTKAPVIASHSSCRALTNSARNMTDDMLRALAKNGGVVMINYNASFISETFRTAPRPAKVTADQERARQRCGINEACSILESERVNQTAMQAGLLPRVTWEAIVEHIDHAVKIAGVDHVGLGSDFDGATMPLGMEDVSKLPAITEALLRRGYTEPQVGKILGGNVLRVMEEVDRRRTQP